MDNLEERNSLLDRGRTFFGEDTDAVGTREKVTFEREQKGFKVWDEGGRERTKEVVLSEDFFREREVGILH